MRGRLLKLLSAGPEAAGGAGKLWTRPWIADLIRREFGVSYHIGYLPTLLKSLGWPAQKPSRSRSRNGRPWNATSRSSTAASPETGRGSRPARRLTATLILFNETGILTQPFGRRAWAPQGPTPVVRHRLRHREKSTVLGSFSVSPGRHRCGLYAEFLPGRSVNQDDPIKHVMVRLGIG
jgi:hypothetical protein